MHARPSQPQSLNRPQVSSEGSTKELRELVSDDNTAPWLRERPPASAMSAFACAGGVVPRGGASKEGMKQTLHVSKVESVHLDLSPGEACSWQWAVRAHDVEFSAEARPDWGEAVVVVAKHRVTADDGWQDGGFVADVSACGRTRLTLRFDNSYSWARSKTVDYVFL